MCKKSLPTDSCQVNWLTLDLKPSAQQTRCKMFLTQGAEWPSRIHMFGLFIFWTESLMNKDRDCGRPQLACAIATSLLQGTVRWAWGLLQGITLKVNFIYDLQKKWGRFWTRVWRIYSNIRIFLIQIFIWIFVHIIFWIRLYSDIRSYQLVGYEYIRIFIGSKILIRMYSDFHPYQFSDSNDVFV